MAFHPLLVSERKIFKTRTAKLVEHLKQADKIASQTPNHLLRHLNMIS